MQPEVDGGRYPAKRTEGEEVRVEADIFVDGHDKVAADLLYRHAGTAPATGAEGAWQRVPMQPLGNDRWQATFTAGARGYYEFTIEAWADRFATWRDGLSKKFGAGQDVSSELVEGATLLRLETADEPKGRSKTEDSRLAAAADLLAGPGEQYTRVPIALDQELSDAMRARPEARGGVVRHARTLRVMVERERARFGAWYEMFPRSAGPDPSRSATFDEAAARLPAIAAMGFDIVYLPPIHPIGRTARKGPNNAITAGPDDPGSPWAIGSADGGHTAVEPGLGSNDDFVRFVRRANDLGLEVALDIAFQTSPDHPWVTQHPEWFRRRADGTIQYAENPPKKYQDIYPLDFESAEWPALWSALRDVFLFWIDRGVTIFRVDNPHTKAFRFWEWAIADIKSRHPDTVFLSEAFTRPAIMRHLAKAGFSQSYSYFTWRNTKAELETYFTELTSTPVREYMRANLFANTPDILHEYLQQGGRPAFQIRLILAATLGASYGIYSGFELAENQPAKPGSEEYLDSEKYQFRQRDWDDPASLAELVTTLNAVRRAHPALQSDWPLAFHATDNDQLIAYSKRDARTGDTVLSIVNLDYAHMQQGWVQLPLADWEIEPGTPLRLADAITGETYIWSSEWNYVRLEPGTRPAHVLVVTQ
ncbi:MAG: alpha-1,4-glucan--maltose-1-phosphate maltosyltransferase [Acidobacteriota bacterium]|nr:alpha-1,4-glucan--maltose-1-phosphate maltosyltransferase [Acidobacteriota bacterium]